MLKATNGKYVLLYKFAGLIAFALFIWAVLTLKDNQRSAELSFQVIICLTMLFASLAAGYYSLGKKMPDGSKIYTFHDNALDYSKAFEATEDNLAYFREGVKSRLSDHLSTYSMEGTAFPAFLDSALDVEKYLDFFTSTSGKRFAVPYKSDLSTRTRLQYLEWDPSTGKYELLKRNFDDSFSRTGTYIYTLPELFKIDN